MASPEPSAQDAREARVTTVAVTGPTGEIGTSVVEALEREPRVERVLGMARRPFDPAGRGWAKTTYRRGDVLDRAAVEGLVADADVVVHLAFLIMGSHAETARTNLTGARNVFEATVDAARPGRLVYASSVAAYGYHAENPTPLTEDVPTRGSPEHYYSRQKAESEVLLREVTDGSDVEVYVLRPCIVAGPNATLLADSMPWNRAGRTVSAVLRSGGRVSPLLRPLVPDPGVPVQLVHPHDVASAVTAAVLGRGSPGAYNLAGAGEVSLGEVARALGGRGVPVPRGLTAATSGVLAHLPLVPALAEWVHPVRTSMVMDTSRATRELGWVPEYTSAEALAAMAEAVRRRDRGEAGRAGR
jgi:nucleoside-diphosphate-sugar epimerase